MSYKKTVTTTTLIGNHVCISEEDFDGMVGAINLGIAFKKENASLRELIASLKREPKLEKTPPHIKDLMKLPEVKDE